MKDPILISEVSLENFRVFKDKSNFELAPITILTGANSSGKSSVIKAMDLMQDFYQDKENSGDNMYNYLDFTENDRNPFHNQLGNFELVLNKENKEKGEFSITYKIPYKYWNYNTYNYLGNLFVVNTFCIDSNDFLKNGRLKTSAIYLEINNGDIVEIHKIDFVNGTKTLNIPEIINKLQSLYEEYLEYKKKVEPFIVDNEEQMINGYSGAIERLEGCTGTTYDDVIDFTYGYRPIVNQQFADFLGVDYTKLQIFNYNSDLFKRAPHCHELHKQQFPKISDFDIFNAFYWKKPQVMELVAQISLDNYDHFEQNLWNLIVKNNPSTGKKYSFESFCKLFEKIDQFCLTCWSDDFGAPKPVIFDDGNQLTIETIKNFIKEIATTDFDSFYRNMICKICNGSLDLINILQYFTMIENSLNSLDYEIDKPLTEPDYEIKSKYNWYDFFTKLDRLFKDVEQYIYELTYNEIEFFYDNCHFIESIRANTQRLYTHISQGTSFNHFLTKFLQKQYSNGFINKWIKNFEIGVEIDFKEGLVEGVGTSLHIKKGDESVNIVDLGYGVTQLLALLLRIVYAGRQENTTIVAIEEPETNLHPNYQSLLADLFVDAHKTFGMNFIIETHSEYLVRKLQYLTASQEINTKDTVIHHIGNPDASKREQEEAQIRTIHIKPNGQLTKPFGPGFYDEADDLAFELFLFSLNE